MKHILITILLLLPLAVRANDTLQVRWNIKDVTIEVTDNTSWKISLLDEDKINYHPVTGITLEETIKLWHRFPKNRFFNLAAMTGYAFSSNQFNASLSASILLEKTLISVEATRDYTDYKGDLGNERMPNSIHSFLTKRNYKSLVNTDRLRAKVFTSFHETVAFEGEALLCKAKHEENNTNFSLFKRDRNFEPNIPKNELLTDKAIEDQTFAQISAIATLFPVYKGYATPQMKIGFGQGIYGNHFTHIYGVIDKQIGSPKETLWNIHIEGGKMWNSNALNFMQWKHYKGSDEFFAIGDRRCGYYGFTTFRTYELSTNNWYLASMVNTSMPKMIVRQIPLIERLFFKEEIYLKSAIIGGEKVYSEVGYGWGQMMFDTLRATLFASFIDNEFQSLKVRISFNL